MASSGWLGERILYGHLGNWPHQDWVGNVRIDSITRNIDNIVVTGITRLCVRSDPGYGGYTWYAGAINVKVSGGNWQTCKPNTGTTVIDGVNYDVGFTTTISAASTATSASFQVSWDDITHGIGWLDNTQTWTIEFPQATRKPNVASASASATSPSVWRLQSSISGIDWGVGYTSRTLKAEVSYTFQGVNYSYTAGTWTDGRTSASIDINSYSDAEPWKKVPAGVQASVKWTASSNIGSDTKTVTVTPKAPTTPSISSMTVSNPDVYKLTSSASGISWGDYRKSASLYAKITGTIDGETISWTTAPVTTAPTTGSFTKDATSEEKPWLFVPDGEDVTVTWYASINVGYTTLVGSISKTQYCQTSYTAYVIEEGVNGGQPVEADLIVSNATGQQPNKAIRRITSL